MIMKFEATQFSSLLYEEFNPYHKTQWKNKPLPFQWNYLHSIYLVVQNLKLIFFGKKFSKNALALKSKKVQDIFRETFILILSSLAVFLLKTLSWIFINVFRSGDKRILLDFMRKWGWFHGHNVSLPKRLGSRINFQKTETQLCRTAMITTALISYCHWKTLVPFCLRKKRPEKAFLTLTVNYRKIVQKKLYHPKQQ